MEDVSPPGMPKDLGPLIGSLDQGTTSTRFLIFVASTGELVTYHALPVQTVTPNSGWAEASATEILETAIQCINSTIENLKQLDIDPADIVSIGIANQRETVVAWSKKTGQPFYNAILWYDTRTGDMMEALSRRPGRERVKAITGLPMSTYFSATRIKWLLENDREVKKAFDDDDLLIGTVDSFLIWHLTGGTSGGKYVTDVTNACRTQLFNIESLQWDSTLFSFFHLPTSLKSKMAEIRSSCEVYGTLALSTIKGTPISACIGDQQAALVGQSCFRPGQAKFTYGTGCFMLYNVGPKIIHSENLISTIAYKMGPNADPVYALEGSVATAGGTISWLQNQLGIIRSPNEVETLAKRVENSGDCILVPAFSGLFAPHWCTDARGLLIGITQSTTKEHLCRAALEAVAFQTRDILEAMQKESKFRMSSLLVDGAMSQNDLLMQTQADVLGIPVLRPSMLETTALGAAIVASQAEGILDTWDSKDDSIQRGQIRHHVSSLDKFLPRLSDEERDKLYERWKMAVERSKGWAGTSTSARTITTPSEKIYASIPAAIFIGSAFLLQKLADFMRKT